MVDDNFHCKHENTIQNLSRKVAELETRATYKDKRIDESYNVIEKMENKLDLLNNNVNHLIIQTTKDDNNLELRLKAIETELDLQKQHNIDNHNRISQLLTIIGVGLTILTIMINIYFNLFLS